VEIWSETFLANGYAPLPDYEEPKIGPVARPDLAKRFPLILTSAKNTLFCNSQHRGLPSLRKRDRDPTVELHPDSAATRGINAGDWVRIESPEGSIRARAQLNANLDPRVVVGQHGWWQGCGELDSPHYDPFSSDGSNLNLLIGTVALDPISGTAPHKAYLCDVRAIA
jgi:anaerobic selenocysteine-containing dehydrogenase